MELPTVLGFFQIGFFICKVVISNYGPANSIFYFADVEILFPMIQIGFFICKVFINNEESVNRRDMIGEGKECGGTFCNTERWYCKMEMMANVLVELSLITTHM